MALYFLAGRMRVSVCNRRLLSYLLEGSQSPLHKYILEPEVIHQLQTTYRMMTTLMASVAEAAGLE